mmetsp:Transcript_67325/g.185530  ORF Transcript_67325/g.185530 Transcript_67325/m.185530 type:complete len:274 (+) Transcript_67325:600-1421(+)
MTGPDSPTDGAACVERERMAAAALDEVGVLIAPALPTDCGPCSEFDCCGQNIGLLCGAPYDCICAGGVCHGLGLDVPVGFPCCCVAGQGDMNVAAPPFQPCGNFLAPFGDCCLGGLDRIGCGCGPAPGAIVSEDDEALSCLGEVEACGVSCCTTICEAPGALGGCVVSCITGFDIGSCCADVGLCCTALGEFLTCDPNPKTLHKIRNPDDDAGFHLECNDCLMGCGYHCCYGYCPCCGCHICLRCISGESGCDACGGGSGRAYDNASATGAEI